MVPAPGVPAPDVPAPGVPAPDVPAPGALVPCCPSRYAQRINVANGMGSSCCCTTSKSTAATYEATARRCSLVRFALPSTLTLAATAPATSPLNSRSSPVAPAGSAADPAPAPARGQPATGGGAR